jgi:hypothetical protein
MNLTRPIERPTCQSASAGNPGHAAPTNLSPCSPIGSPLQPLSRCAFLCRLILSRVPTHYHRQSPAAATAAHWPMPRCQSHCLVKAFKPTVSSGRTVFNSPALLGHSIRPLAAPAHTIGTCSSAPPCPRALAAPESPFFPMERIAIKGTPYHLSKPQMPHLSALVSVVAVSLF